MNKPLLISLVLALVGIKFVIVPWLEYQQSQHDLLVASTKRLQRAESLVANTGQLDQVSKSVNEHVDNILARIPSTTGSEQYRLHFQQNLQKNIEKNGVSLESFEWVGDTQVVSPDIYQASVSMQLKGKAADIALLMAEFEVDRADLKVTDMTVTSRKPITLSEDINAAFLIQATYKVADNG